MPERQEKEGAEERRTPVGSERVDPVQEVWLRFVDEVEPLRSDLFQHGLRLTRNAFDAEDLVQDALLRAFGMLGQRNQEIGSLRAYLLRVLTNLWIDEQRRHKPILFEGELDELKSRDGGQKKDVPSLALRDATVQLGGLRPRERAAVVLKEGFDLSHRAIAEILTTSEGAVKVALHRGRKHLEALRELPSAEPRVSTELVDRFVDAFRRHDLEAVKGLLAEDMEAQNFPSGVAWGREYHAKKGWLNGSFYHHIPEREKNREPHPLRLEVVDLLGERVVLVFRGEPEALEEVWLLEEQAGEISRIRDYCFCPDLVEWVGQRLGLPCRVVGYRFHPPQSPAS